MTWFNMTMLPSTNITNSSAKVNFLIMDSTWWFGQIFPFVIIIFGTLGNSLTVHILSKKSYAGTTCYYMKALALSDSFVMLLLFIRWLSKVPGTPMERDTSFCVLYFFFVRFGFGISAWILMAITIDRYVSVRFPFKAKSLCTIRRAKIVLVVIAIVHIVSHLPYFWRYSNPNGRTLSEKCPYNLPNDFAVAYQIIRMVAFDRLLPWLLTIGFTAATTYELYYRMNKRLENLKVNTDKKMARRVTLMSVSIAWVFFLFTFPTTVYESIRVLKKLRMPRFLYELFVYLLYLNSAVNFYVYLLVARQVRRDFKKMVSSCLVRTPCLGWKTMDVVDGSSGEKLTSKTAIPLQTTSEVQVAPQCSVIREEVSKM